MERACRKQVRLAQRFTTSRPHLTPPPPSGRTAVDPLVSGPPAVFRWPDGVRTFTPRTGLTSARLAVMLNRGARSRRRSVSAPPPRRSLPDDNQRGGASGAERPAPALELRNDAARLIACLARISARTDAASETHILRGRRSEKGGGKDGERHRRDDMPIGVRPSAGRSAGGPQPGIFQCPAAPAGPGGTTPYRPEAAKGGHDAADSSFILPPSSFAWPRRADSSFRLPPSSFEVPSSFEG